MFESLSDRFDGILTRLRKKGALTESDVDEVLREIRVALLEADVALPVVRGFVKQVKERARGAEVSEALNPAQQVVKIVNEELTTSLGGDTLKITYASKPPTVVVTFQGPSACTPLPRKPCALDVLAEAADPDGDPIRYAWSGCASGTSPSPVCADEISLRQEALVA